MPDVEGGCLCGAVRYAVTTDPVMVVACHCTHCRRQGGSAFSVNALFAEDAFRLHGELQNYQDVGDSGNSVLRRFCGRCGSPILTIAQVMPGHVAIKVGTFDEPYPFAPALEIYCDGALPWMPSLPDTDRKGGGT